MKRSIGSILNKKSLFVAFCVNLLIGAVSFGWTIALQGGVFSLAGDFNSQQIPFTMHAIDMVKSGQWGYDYAIDLGSGFIGSMAFYLLGTPGFWLASLMPSKYFMYIVGWLYVLKYAVAGTTSYLYISRYVKQPRSALIGSILYAFSGFMNENLLFYHFHDVVMLFPLMLAALDDLVEKKRRGPFIFAVAVNALVNYYFILGEVIFLIVYYLIKWFIPDFQTYGKSIFRVLFEGICGGVMSLVLLWPAFLFVIQNPRVKVDYLGNNALVYSGQRYLFILKALLFPGEVMSDHTAVIARNFSSCAAYLPMVGMMLAIAFCLYRKKHFLTRMLKASLVIACVPILNAAFSAFAGLYCRWYYMPILMMATVSAVMLDELLVEEEREEEVIAATDKALIITLAVTVFFILFLTLVKWSNSEPSLIYRPVLFAVYSAVSVFGTALTWFFAAGGKKNRFRRFFIALLVFTIGTTAGNVVSYQLEHGKQSQDLYDQIRTSERFEYDPAYRFASNDNVITLSHGFSATGNFCSTVSGSIFRFYEAIGLSRDVKSPDPPTGLYTLVSAKYEVEEEKKVPEHKSIFDLEHYPDTSSQDTEEEDPDDEKDDARVLIGTYEGTYRTYYEYENENIPAIGFTYDKYITRSEFDKLAKDKKVVYMLGVLVIEDEKEDDVAKRLTHLLNYNQAYKVSDLERLGLERKKEESQVFERNAQGFRSVIIADSEKYAFFSIPNDDGWTASVNGVEQEILDINGFMAVPVSEGENDIVFSYTTPGLQTGIYASLAAICVSVVYLITAFVIFLVRRHKERSA